MIIPIHYECTWDKLVVRLTDLPIYFFLCLYIYVYIEHNIILYILIF